MKKILLVLVGFVLLVPTVLIAAMGAGAGSDGAPIAFGVWMFFGLPTMVGAIFAFIKANKPHQDRLT
jgi:hypothetical protein